jgi:hypothetical protein
MDKKSLAIYACFALSMCCSAHAAAAEENIIEMRGFRVEYAKVGPKAFSKMQPSLEKQFEIVEAANVPPTVLEFFKTIPVVIVPDLKVGYGRAGMVDGRQIAELKAAKLPSDRPILLHEFLHGYHGKRIGRSPIIIGSHREALETKMYPKHYEKAHFLENPREYFAVLATIYLFDERLDQPPFDCKITAKKQPQFIAFLAEHFGPRACE